MLESLFNKVIELKVFIFNIKGTPTQAFPVNIERSLKIAFFVENLFIRLFGNFM